MASMSYVQSLQKEKFPGISKVRRLPDIEEYKTKKSGKMFRVNYFFFKGNNPRMVGISSKDKSFKTITYVTVYDLKMRPAFCIWMEPTIEKADFIAFLGKLITETKYTMPAKGRTQTEGMAAVGAFASKMFTNFNPSVALQGILFGFIVFQLFSSQIKRVSFWYEERHVAGPLEEKNNKALFAGQTGQEPAYAVFSELNRYINHIVQKQANALIICGPPGMSKTYTVRRVLHFSGLKPRKDYVIEKGSTLGLGSTYDMLYTHRKKILVLDDFDKPLTDPDIVNLLKGITDTYSRRLISLPRDKRLQTGQEQSFSGTPDKFDFEGQLIIITNLLRTQIDPALVSRAPAIEINFNAKEVMDNIQKMIKYILPSVPTKVKWEVYHYIEKMYQNDPKITVTFRSFVNGINARVGNPKGWKPMLEVIVGYRGKKIVEQYLYNLSLGD